jgi:hypothetical protein
MKTPTDRQIDLLSKNLTNWAIVDNDYGNLLEVFPFEDTAKEKLKRIQSLGKGKNWFVRSITWKFSTHEIVESQRSSESWIRGNSDFSPQETIL